jgi:hypothetical protein
VGAAKKYPIEILPRTSETIFISDIATFREMINEHFIHNRRGVFQRSQYRFLRPIIVTEDGERFRVKLDKKVWEEIANLRNIQREKYRKVGQIKVAQVYGKLRKFVGIGRNNASDQLRK